MCYASSVKLPQSSHVFCMHLFSDCKQVEVSTVDAFQGGERAVIILSCVRTHSVGFIDSDKYV